MNRFLTVVVIFLFQLPLTAATVRVSFLSEQTALRDTLQLLRNNGCTPPATAAFQRAVERYWSTSFNFDFSRFPKPRAGFYSFESASDLVEALPHPICDTQHVYEFNCFDTVVTLAGETLRTSVRPDRITGPFLVPYTPTNGSFTILARATARDAFMLVYPAWYRETTEGVMPMAMRDARISLTATLFSCHMLPQSTTENGLGSGVMETLRASWSGHEMKFPTRFEVVLCHEVSLPQCLVVTTHAALLFRRERGYTYLEKGGGKGPFVRLDFDDRQAVLRWLGRMFRGAEKLGYTHHFATFNDTKIEQVEFRNK